MWKLLWTESKYNKPILASAFAFCFICLIVIWFGVRFEHNRVPLVMLIILITTFISFFTSEGGNSKEKRNRLKGILPISPSGLYLSRVLFPILLLAGTITFLFILFVVLTIFGGGSLSIPSVGQLLTLNGLVLIVISVFLLNIDMKTAITATYARVLVVIAWISIYLLALLPFFIITDFLGAFGRHIFLQESLLSFLSSITGIIILNAAGLTLITMNLIIFLHRRTYV